MFSDLIDLFLHLDKHFADVVRDYGAWTYAILSLIVFAETGLVFTPFLPGDSLIFAAGTIAATADLNVWLLFLLLTVAAIIGDTVNYSIGKHFGAYLVRRHSRWLKQQHLDKTHAFFEKYGGKTIVIARFVPIVRTFAPFVAGMGAMGYRKFVAYNITGAIIWVSVCLAAGYRLAKVQVVRENFSLVVLAIIFVSILPGIIGFISARAAERRKQAALSRTDDAAS